MNLYLISQNKVAGHDTYDSAVVAAESSAEARRIHPSTFVTHVTNGKWMGTYSGDLNAGSEYINETDSWVKYEDIEYITVEYLGKTIRSKGVVLASFN